MQCTSRVRLIVDVDLEAFMISALLHLTCNSPLVAAGLVPLHLMSLFAWQLVLSCLTRYVFTSTVAFSYLDAGHSLEVWKLFDCCWHSVSFESFSTSPIWVKACRGNFNADFGDSILKSTRVCI